MKRLLALVVALAMVLSLLPMSVLASESDSSAEPEVTAVEEAPKAEPVEETVVDTTEPAEESKAEEETPAEEEKPAEETPAEEAPAEETSKQEETPAEEAPAEETPAEDASEEKAPEQETAVSYPAQTFQGKDNGVTVNVTADEGTFPEGTIMKVTKFTDEDVIAAAKDAVEGEATTVKAVDIAFFNAEGEEIEPLKEVHVKLTSDVVKQAETPVVVHVDDEGEAKVIEETEVKKDTVEFYAGEFSVYVIIGTDDETQTPYRTTYYFKNADGSKYEFYDASGKKVDNQILKDGEKLEEVGIPTKGASKNAKFIGWYDDNGKEVKIGEAQSVTSNGTVNLTAKFQGIINVFFVTAVAEGGAGRSVVTVKQVEFTTGQTTPTTVDTTDVTTDAPSAEQAVIGWSLDETKANAGELDNDGTITLTGTNDVTLFPVIASAYWLTFNENDGEAGGASYTPPQYVTVNDVTKEPDEDPSRNGYEFGGWYEDENCTTKFTFGNKLTKNTTVYAKWIPHEAPYTIIIWKQKVTDDKNAADSAKTYDYVASESQTGQTGESVSAPSKYEGYGNQDRVTINGTAYNFVGFHYGHKDAAKTVEADGSTVLNVYYDRNLITINFDYPSGANEADTSYTGLYGQTLASQGYTWPTTYTTGWGMWMTTYNTLWTDGTTTLVFLDAFKLPNPKNTTLNLDTTDAGDYTARFYKQNVDGSWPAQATNTASTSTGAFYITDKYEGFTAYQYRYQNSQNTWSNWDSVGTKDTNTGHYKTIPRGHHNIEIRFKRDAYKIEFHNGVKNAQGTIVRTDEKLQGASLAGLETPTGFTYPDAANASRYEFIGWFADPQLTRMVTFGEEVSEARKKELKDYYGVEQFTVYNEMPMYNLPVYAGWFLKGYDVALNPNGGELAESQAGVFWLEDGKTVNDSIMSTTTRRGYTLTGWMISTVDGDLKDVERRPPNNYRYVGDFSNWTMGGTPWNFDTPVTGPLFLTAKWFSLDTLQVVYDAGEGKNPPEDKGDYRDQAQTVVFGAPEAPENSTFEGWDMVGTDEVEKLQPGDTFTIDSQYATDGKITLQAVYHTFNPDEEVPVTHIDWYANNGTDEMVSDTDLQTNQAVDIKSANTFTYSDHTFLGWAKLSVNDTKDPATLTADDLWLTYDAAKNEFTYEGKVATQVAADEVQPYENLYAVWEGCFYIYHSGTKGGNIETHKVEEIQPYTYRDTNLLYGGYYLEGGFDMPEDKAAYDGSNWTWTTPQTNKSYTPKVGETIYLKEVPTTYLVPNMYAIWDTYHNVKKIGSKTGYKVIDLFLMTAVDDDNYKTVGYNVTGMRSVTDETTSDTVDALTDVFKVTKNGEKYEDVTSQSAFGVDGKLQVTEKEAYIKSGAQFKAVAYWTTMDGVTVTGVKRMTGILGNAYYFNWATPGIRKLIADI